jgi:hypothetical protein
MLPKIPQTLSKNGAAGMSFCNRQAIFDPFLILSGWILCSRKHPISRILNSNASSPLAIVCGENPLSLRRRSSNARLVSNRSDLLKNSPVAGITAGPVARPVLRIQGSRNLLNASMSDDDSEQEDEAEQMEIQSNPMIARPELKSHLSTEDDTSSTSAKTQRNPRSLPARGFGRGFPSRKPSTGKLMSTPSIPEEQEESSKSLNYSESTEIFGPSESFESLQVSTHPPPPPSLLPSLAPPPPNLFPLC